MKENGINIKKTIYLKIKHVYNKHSLYAWSLFIEH